MKLMCAGIKYYFINAITTCRCGHTGHPLNAVIDNNRTDLLCSACGNLEQQIYGDEDDSQTKHPGLIPLEVGKMVKQIREQHIEVIA